MWQKYERMKILIRFFFLGKTLLMVGAVSAAPGAIYKRLLEEMTQDNNEKMLFDM